MTHRHAIIKNTGDQRITSCPAAIHHGIRIKDCTVGKGNMVAAIGAGFNAGHHTCDELHLSALIHRDGRAMRLRAGAESRQ